MKLLKKPFFFLAILLIPAYSFGWGVLGHRIVGQIAESYLTPKARAAIRKILGQESIAMVSNWADFIRSDSTMAYLSSWHYIDFDPGLTADQVRAYLATDTATDIYTKTNFLVKELKNKKLPLAKKQMDLKLLIHFVGDIHQPMHAGQKDDQGGNKIKLSWFNNPVNLHSVWDEQLINFQQLSYTEYTAVINHSTPKQRLAWQKQPIREWIVESYQLSQQLYKEIIQPEQRLGYKYNYDHIAQLNERLLKAGIRLAGLLNQLFG